MTLDEAINHAQEKADNSTCGCEHQQLAGWLIELKQIRKQRDKLVRLLERASTSIGAFTSDESWSSSDMDTMDSIDATLAKIIANNAGHLP